MIVFRARVALALLVLSGALFACTSDLALGVDRAAGDCAEDCSKACPSATVAACDGGVLNAACECTKEEVDTADAGNVVDASDDEDAMDEESPDEESMEDVEDTSDSEDPEDPQNDAGGS